MIVGTAPRAKLRYLTKGKYYGLNASEGKVTLRSSSEESGRTLFILNILASLLATLIYNYFILPPLGKNPSVASFIWPALIAFVLIGTILYFRYIIHVYHKMFINLYYSIQSVTNMKIEHHGKESEFESQCKNRLVTLLNSALSFQEMRFNFKKQDSDPWAAIFLPCNGDKLKLFVQSNRSGGHRLDPNTILHSDRYFPSYCYHYDEAEKIQRPEDIDAKQIERNIKERLILDNMILMRQGFKKINNRNCLDIQSGLGKCLKYQNQKIGVLLLGSKRKKYFTRLDVKPISIISQKITSELIHFKFYCPWHKMGWRDQIEGEIIREVRFSFSPNAYLNPSLKAKIDETIVKSYDELIKSLCSLPIKSVRLCGTFNGWNEAHVFLSKVGNGLWETYLHLPLGYYEYRYFVEFEDGRVVGPTQNWIFDINSQTEYDVEYGFYSKKFVG